jgi:hypothetical protein
LAPQFAAQSFFRAILPRCLHPTSQGFGGFFRLWLSMGKKARVKLYPAFRSGRFKRTRCAPSRLAVSSSRWQSRTTERHINIGLRLFTGHGGDCLWMASRHVNVIPSRPALTTAPPTGTSPAGWCYMYFISIQRSARPHRDEGSRLVYPRLCARTRGYRRC